MSNSAPNDEMVRSLELQREGRPLPGYFAWAREVELSEFENSAAKTPDFLATAERNYFGTLRFPVRQCSYLLGRLAAKRAISPMKNGALPSEIDVLKGVFEQPVLASGGVEISIAHSGQIAVAVSAPSGHPIGVDIEKFGGPDPKVLASSFTAQEEKWLRKLELPHPVAMYAAWTAKEALAKILRCGLMTPLQVLEITEIDPKGNHAFESLFTYFPQYKSRTWILNHFALSIALPARTEMRFEPGSEFVQQLATPP
jgi:phosphopantetheinyl transferase